MAVWREHITVEPAILVGKPVVRGTRLAVEFVLELIAGGLAGCLFACLGDSALR